MYAGDVTRGAVSPALDGHFLYSSPLLRDHGNQAQQVKG